MLLSGYQLGRDGRKGKEKDREGREGEGRGGKEGGMQEVNVKYIVSGTG